MFHHLDSEEEDFFFLLRFFTFFFFVFTIEFFFTCTHAEWTRLKRSLVLKERGEQFVSSGKGKKTNENVGDMPKIGGV